MTDERKSALRAAERYVRELEDETFLTSSLTVSFLHPQEKVWTKPFVYTFSPELPLRMAAWIVHDRLLETFGPDEHGMCPVWNIDLINGSGELAAVWEYGLRAELKGWIHPFDRTG